MIGRAASYVSKWRGGCLPGSPDPVVDANVIWTMDLSIGRWTKLPVNRRSYRHQTSPDTDSTFTILLSFSRFISSHVHSHSLLPP